MQRHLRKRYLPTSFKTNKRVFGQDYNYSLFKPRKDQCSVCMKYQRATDEQKTLLEPYYLAHKEQEADANNSKKSGKEKASSDPHFVIVTFDLQSVRQIPCSDVSPSKKLCGYNLWEFFT